MQVADSQDHITHVVLGGASSISFGISDDPAFFQILSQSLYKDPLLAMIRETICNAWDAHIDAGRTDQPINVTLTQDKLIIRDYGKGIHRDLIGPIYGVYGASTKKRDGRQTGGFGLGCKSPYAYTDHFEVVSCHEGTRTIYNMSKSSAEAMGKPSITPIASFPTTESGIQVSIPLKGGFDDSRIMGIIYQVVYSGDISALLNGDQLPNMNLSSTENGFILIRYEDSNSLPDGLPHNFLDTHDVYVRYGNVIYPVETNIHIESLLQKVTTITSQRYKSTLIMMAPPDSISVAPNREHLTESELTVNTIKSLLTKFLACMVRNRMITTRSKEMAKEFVIKSAQNTNVPIQDKVHVTHWNIPGIKGTVSKGLISTSEDIALLETLIRYSKHGSGLRSREWLASMNLYLTTLAKEKLLDRGLVNTWQHTAKRIGGGLKHPECFEERRERFRRHRKLGSNEGILIQDEQFEATRWWQKRIMLPLVDKILKAVPTYKVTDIEYYSQNVGRIDRYKENSPMRVNRVAIMKHTFNIHHLVKPTLVISHNNASIKNRVDTLLKTKYTGSLRSNSYFCVEVPRKDSEKAPMMEALSSLQDVEVIDLTGRLPYEQEIYQRRSEAAKKAKVAKEKNPKLAVVKKAKPGLIRADEMLFGSSIFNELFSTNPDPVRIVEPEFIAKISVSSHSMRNFKGFSDYASYLIAKLWGDVGAVTNNSGIEAKYVNEKGVKTLDKFVLEKLITDIAVDPEVTRFFAIDPDKVYKHFESNGRYDDVRKVTPLYRFLNQASDMNSLIPGFTSFSEQTLFKVALWKECAMSTYYRSNEARAINDGFNKIPLDNQVTVFAEALAKNPYLGILDMDNLESVYLANQKDPAIIQKLVDVVKLIVN